jgi:hypothetical protein
MKGKSNMKTRFASELDCTNLSSTAKEFLLGLAQLFKNVTMNKSDEKRHGTQVRRLSPATTPRVALFFVRDEQSMGCPSLA